MAGKGLDVLYYDNHLLVVCKGQGVLAQADATGDCDLLSLAKSFIKTRFKRRGNVYLGLVHRLDRPVSGVMVLARTTKAASRLSAQFRAGMPEKKYLALVEGSCSGSGTCCDYLVKENRRVMITDAAHPRARYAELCWRSAAQGQGLTLLEVDLKTGRPHQIRIQLSHMGFPVLGDMRYGARREFDGKNLALHCFLIGIVHPVKKEPVQWTAPPPPAWHSYFSREIEAILEHREKTEPSDLTKAPCTKKRHTTS